MNQNLLWRSQTIMCASRNIPALGSLQVPIVRQPDFTFGISPAPSSAPQASPALNCSRVRWAGLSQVELLNVSSNAVIGYLNYINTQLPRVINASLQCVNSTLGPGLVSTYAQNIQQLSVEFSNITRVLTTFAQNAMAAVQTGQCIVSWFKSIDVAMKRFPLYACYPLYVL